MSVLTLVTLLVVAFGVFSSRGYGSAIALGGSTAAGAAIVVGSVAVPTFYAVALGAGVSIVLQIVAGSDPWRPRLGSLPGVGLLVAFLGWSILVTLAAPTIFDGLVVLEPNGSRDILAAGALTSSNIAQIVYLVLGVCVVVFISRSKFAGPELIGLAAGVTTILCLWRYFHQVFGVPFPEGVFDNSPSFSYIETAAGGVQRFRGILSEPAGLAVSSLVTISYMVPRSRHLRGFRRAGALALAGAAAYMGAISTSATFVVAGAVVVLMALVVFALSFLSRRTTFTAVVSVCMCGLAIASIWLIPLLAQFVESTIYAKVASASFSDRSGADSVSYGIFVQTYGLGVGLGSNRAASFVPGVLSATGLVGFVLLFGAIGVIIWRAALVSEYRPVVWALVTLLVVKIVAGPDLSDSSGVFWISLGLLSRAGLIAKERSASIGRDMRHYRWFAD